MGVLTKVPRQLIKKNENEILSAIATNDSMNSSTHQKTITNDSDSGAMLARNLNQCSEASDREGELGTPSAIIVLSDSVDNNQSLPFVKCSPIWQSIESMEIFQKTPQKPHFSPLVNCNEDLREGLAIAHIVTFSNLMERTSKLRFSDPSSSIERSLEILADLELHGFDVEAVRVRLNDMLLKKDRERELQSEYRNIENEITKSNLEKAEFEKEIDKIQLKIREFAKKLVAVTSMKEMKEQEISTLGSKLDTIRENIKSIQLD